jgi:dTDP-4-dehydrorhamnose reductase
LPFFKSNLFLYEQMDFTVAAEVDTVIEQHKPLFIIHAGAISKQDDCETNQELAYNVNVQGTINLLNASAKYNSFFVFVSTDFIFDGEKGMYNEDDLPNPVNYYGKTKMLAETEVKKYTAAWCIVRTVLVYGKPNSGRNNLLTIVKEKLERGEGYSVFNDQQRTPTYVGDLADGIIEIIKNKASGVFHISGKDLLTPYEMACKTADFLGLDRSLIKKITEKDMQQVAKRPLKTGFTIDKAKKQLNYNPVSFDEGLEKTFIN